PSPDRSKYPGRPSMNTTIEFVKSELQLAYAALAEFQEIDPAEIDPYYSPDTYPYVLVQPNGSYVSTWAVRTMQARIALWLGDYQNALNISEEIINSGVYKLANTSTYKNMWTRDVSNEVIFRPYMNSQELSNSIGSAWIGKQTSEADYIPTPQSITQYKEPGLNALRQERDCRYSAFIEERTLQTAFGDINAPCFVKFPGNRDLMTGATVNLINMPKVFRLSEVYFIAMESAAMLNKENVANEYLDTYMKNRVSAYKHDTLSGPSLIEQIRKERGLELNGEGFRLSDLRRWKKGFSRSGGTLYESNPEISMILTKAGLTVAYDGDDYRYTWPIPADELQCNPQMAGQQNPGY
ncbi:MAG: RagB/SusD family nutrient uptake outer membrane protein, partial [Allobaculum sp.]|nr:RagB/SusD family nutrient uptake outer membrane protein [Allobaculum sp.]